MTLENCERLLKFFEDKGLKAKAEAMRDHIAIKKRHLQAKGMLPVETKKAEVKKDEKSKG